MCGVDEGKRHSRLQIAGFISAALLACSTITLLTGVALGLDHPHGRRGGGGDFPAGDIFGSAIGTIVIVALAVLTALPMRYYAGKAVRWAGTLSSGSLTAGGLALALLSTLFVPFWLEGTGWLRPVAAVSAVSMFGTAIILFLKSRAGEEETRQQSASARDRTAGEYGTIPAIKRVRHGRGRRLGLLLLLGAWILLLLLTFGRAAGGLELFTGWVLLAVLTPIVLGGRALEVFSIFMGGLTLLVGGVAIIPEGIIGPFRRHVHTAQMWGSIFAMLLVVFVSALLFSPDRVYRRFWIVVCASAAFAGAVGTGLIVAAFRLPAFKEPTYGAGLGAFLAFLAGLLVLVDFSVLCARLWWSWRSRKARI